MLIKVLFLNYILISINHISDYQRKTPGRLRQPTLQPYAKEAGLRVQAHPHPNFLRYTLPTEALRPTVGGRPGHPQ
jgi:hypothetical protein